MTIPLSFALRAKTNKDIRTYKNIKPTMDTHQKKKNNNENPLWTFAEIGRAHV